MVAIIVAMEERRESGNKGSQSRRKNSRESTRFTMSKDATDKDR